MSRAGRDRRREEPAAGSRGLIAWSPKRVRQLAAAGLAGLLVAMALIPGESAAETGSGVVFVMAGLLLSVLLSAGLLLVRGSEFRWGWPDTLVLVFLVLQAGSAAVMARYGDQRATLNAAWQWFLLGLVFLLARQVFFAAAQYRAVSVVMISLAVGLSCLAFHQYYVSMPQLRAEYARDPEQVLRVAGVDSRLGSPERRLFEDRLQGTEPTATFALTNSLAGLVVTWLTVVAGVGLVSWRERPRGWPLIIALAVSAGLLGFCLLLTKSRTAVLSGAAGMTVLGWIQWRSGRRWSWRVPLIVIGAALLLVGGAVAAGALDWLVLSETPKSLLYRLEYWQATLALIRDHVWFGCGPGNFQLYYAGYKLPQASETVADPHNFLLEVWATAGTPAVLAFAAVLVLLAFRVLRGSARGLEADTPVGTPARAGTGGDSAPYAIYAGAGLGWLFGFICRPIVGFPPDIAVVWVGLTAAIVTAAACHRWAGRGTLPAWLFPTAILVLLLNLSAAGGISIAGVAGSWWLLLALIANGQDVSSGWRKCPRGAHVAAVAVTLGLTAAGHQTCYAPVLHAQARMQQGLAAAGAGRFQEAEADFRAAADDDPFDAQPWLYLAAMYHDRMVATGRGDFLTHFDGALEQARRCRRLSPSHQSQLGDWRLALYRRGLGTKQLDQALADYRTWTRLYPNSSRAHAQLAWCLAVAGDASAAAEEAGIALRLDGLNPHQERKLARQQVFEPTPDRLPCTDAEQLMRRLRTGPAGA